MFRFFNQARQVALSEGSTIRFLRYSLGEIVLVVIGILVALQINNWNEERVEQKEIREYALNLSAAIDRDKETGLLEAHKKSMPPTQAVTTSFIHA